ncbi:MAG TPA: pirin-like C-terminal cupin domain-containing protein, partial [Polyangiaceae bacterium]|nr:pirin-like C-terminal cupin domain-containing protein [Polyangiaceae bacterium]
EVEPAFEHHPGATLPHVDLPGASLRILAGHAYGARSPVGVRSPTLYVHAELQDGADLPLPDDHEERAAYVVEGEVRCGGQTHGPGSMLIFRPGAAATLRAGKPSRLMLLGGARLDGSRHIFWNFVSSSKDRIERAKDEWKRGVFPKVPGDDVEFIPLPE